MSLTASSIGRKVAMALSVIFLVLFLTQHFSINLLSVFSESLFNQVSHFMGNNPIVQFILQPILIFGVLFHFVMGFVLELQNSKSRSTSYSVYKGKTNASWMSRNMILSGIVILSFLGLHFYDFWVPEMNYKYVQVLPLDQNRYFEELVHKFESPVRVIIYAFSFANLMGLCFSGTTLTLLPFCRNVLALLEYAFPQVPQSVDQTLPFCTPVFQGD